MARAHRRGVNLRVITDNDKLFDEGSDIERLSSAGIPVRVDNTEYHMHHKFAIFDGTLLLNGSYNWTRSAALYNEENYILTGDQRLIRFFAELFNTLWEKFGSK
jgi:mitochondrial cardiolipin hydrolase